MVKKFGLRKGDVITGVIRSPRDGERKEKFNPLVRLETVNGGDPEAAKNRVEFSKLTPLYPQERLKLETTPTQLVGRIIDLICPDRQGPARPDRLAVQGRQDHDHAVHRQRHHHQQP